MSAPRKGDTAARPGIRSLAGSAGLTRLRGILRASLRPRVFISLTLSAGLLAALLSFGNVRDILAEVSRFQLADVFWFLGAYLLSELGRWLLWYFLVGSLGVEVRARVRLLSFLMGEVSKNLPFGNYFPNYVLRRAEGVDFGLTAAITTTIVLMEVTVSLAGVVVVGLGGWNAWLRPLILVGAPVFIACAWLVYRWRAAAGVPHWMERYGPLRDLLAELKAFRDGASRLWHPHTIALGLVICACYIGAAATGLFVITRGLHASTPAWQQVLAVYCFSLAFALIEPTPVDLGVTEVGGVAAFLAVGMEKDPAIAAMLINRVFSVSASLLLVSIGLIVLRGELRTVLVAEDAPERNPQETVPVEHVPSGEAETRAGQVRRL